MVDLAQLELRIKSLEVAEAQRRLDKFSASGKKATDTGKKLEKGMDRTSKGAARLKSSLGQAARAMAPLVAGFVAIAGARAAVKTLADYEYTLAQVRGVAIRTNETLKKQEEQFKALSKQARELGAVTRFTATQAGEAQLFLARAGFEVFEILEALPGVLDLAAAGVLELGEAADIASNVLNQFRLEAAAMDHVGDVLVNTANKSNTNILQLAEGLKMAGPIAGALGKSLEETAAAMGVLGDAGIQATLGGTQLRGVMSALLGPTSMAEKTLSAIAARLGETRTIFDINTHSLEEIFKAFKKAGTSAEEFNEIFSRRQTAGAVLLTEYADKLGDLSEENKKVLAESKRLANIMNNTLRGSFLALVSAVQNLILNGGEAGLGKTFKDLVDLMTDVFRYLGGMEDKVESNIIVVTLLANGLKALVVVIAAMLTLKIGLWLGKLISGFKAARGEAGGFYALLKKHPYTLVAVAAVALTTALFTFISRTKEASEHTKRLNKDLEDLEPRMARFDELFAGLDRAVEGGDFVTEIEKRKASLVALEEEIIKLRVSQENFPVESLLRMRVSEGDEDIDLSFYMDETINAWAKETSNSGRIKDFSSLWSAFIKNGFAAPEDEEGLRAELQNYFNKVFKDAGVIEDRDPLRSHRDLMVGSIQKLNDDFKPEAEELATIFKSFMKLTHLKPGPTLEFMEDQVEEVSRALSNLPEASGLKAAYDQVEKFGKALDEALAPELGFDLEGVQELTADFADLKKQMEDVAAAPTEKALKDVEKALIGLEHRFEDLGERKDQTKALMDHVAALKEEAKAIAEGGNARDALIERRKWESKLDAVSKQDRERLLELLVKEGLMSVKNAEAIIEARQKIIDKEQELALEREHAAKAQLAAAVAAQLAYADMGLTDDEARIAAVRREMEQLALAAGITTAKAKELGAASAELESWIIQTEKVKSAFSNMGREAGNQLKGMALDGKSAKDSLRDLLDNVAGNIFDTFVTSAIEQQMSALGGQLMGSLGGSAAAGTVLQTAGATSGALLAAGGASAGAAMVSAATQAAGILGLGGMAAGAGAGAGAAGGGGGAAAAGAKGLIVSAGKVIPFARGGLRQAAGAEVVSSPTLFPMKNGAMGLMGEGRKKEGIFPLEQGSGGKYGLQTSIRSGGRLLTDVADLRRMPNGDLGIEVNLDKGPKRPQQFKRGGVLGKEPRSNYGNQGNEGSTNGKETHHYTQKFHTKIYAEDADSFRRAPAQQMKRAFKKTGMTGR